MFPAGTNVEFAQVDGRDRVRILIWERGVGRTSSSGRIVQLRRLWLRPMAGRLAPWT